MSRSVGVSTDDGAPEATVRLVRWPEETALLERLRSDGTPRLLLVPGATPAPETVGCEEDWVRLPAGDADVRARVLALVARSSRHRAGPKIGADGRLRYGTGWIALSPIEHRLARLLSQHFGEVVPSRALSTAAWPGEGMNEGALRVHLTRLRRRLRPAGLDVQNVRGRGYLLEHVTG
ncbi:MAG: winged helix-turn-helix domain-containing protein [Acidimicrobiia bacterium]|nr:winged helix-turn-helix domain-containing protein [Acidimicrobiia bacterium]